MPSVTAGQPHIGSTGLRVFWAKRQMHFHDQAKCGLTASSSVLSWRCVSLHVNAHVSLRLRIADACRLRDGRERGVHAVPMADAKSKVNVVMGEESRPSTQSRESLACANQP